MSGQADEFPMTTNAEVETRLLAFVREEIFRDQVALTVETNLVEAGFDSMSLVSLLLFLEREYGIWLRESEITVAVLENIRSLAAHVTTYLS